MWSESENTLFDTFAFQIKKTLNLKLRNEIFLISEEGTLLFLPFCLSKELGVAEGEGAR